MAEPKHRPLQLRYGGITSYSHLDGGGGGGGGDNAGDNDDGGDNSDADAAAAAAAAAAGRCTSRTTLPSS